MLNIRAFDLHSLLGNIGGYVGIFIGYALLNLPDAIMNMKHKVSRKGKHHEDEKRSDGDKFIDDVLVMSNGCDNSSKIKKLEEQMEQVHQTLKSLKLETIIK